MASTPGAQLTPRIANYEASADEVLQWYGSEDPVNEDHNWALVRNLASSSFSVAERRELTGDRMTHDVKLNESAALTMLLSTAGVTEG
jgi:hypothetical protein